VLYKLFFFMLPLALGLPSGFGSTVDTDAALKMVEAEENKLQSLKWKFQFEDWRTTPEGPQKQPVNIAGQVTYDLEKRRYHIVGVQTLQWHGGKSDLISSRFGMAFDGSRYQDWHHYWHGTVPPPPIIDPAGGINEGIDIHALKVDEKHAWVAGTIGPNEPKGMSFANYYGGSGLQYIGPLFRSETAADGVQRVS
jgi:hypothetical protein